jgi:uncharacterized membrane protein
MSILQKLAIENESLWMQIGKFFFYLPLFSCVMSTMIVVVVVVVVVVVMMMMMMVFLHDNDDVTHPTSVKRTDPTTSTNLYFT